MHILDDKLEFPDLNTTAADGLIAVGGDLSIKRLLLAYRNGIFPWYEKGQPILWWAPNPRFVLFPERLKVSKSTRQFIHNADLKVTVNTAFADVISNCAKVKRNGQAGTWITTEMQCAYINLHKQGFATSVEVWQNNVLVGGFYGVDLQNGIFSGESMFSLISNASKMAFVTFVENSHYKLIDCQVYTSHLERFGAEEISRNMFMSFLK